MDLLSEIELQQRCLILVAAMVIDAIWGEPGWLWQRLPHPVVLFGRLISWTSHYGNQRQFSGQQRRINGIITISLCGSVALIAGYGLAQIGFVAELVCLSTLLAGRSLHEHVKAVADTLSENLAAARHSISMIVGRRTAEMTTAEISRAAIETNAENLSDGVIAPAAWFLLFGLPGLFFYKMINTADSMVAYKNARFYAYGWAAAKLDDLANFLPARLTGGLLALASIGAPGGMMAALRSMVKDAAKHSSPNAGWPEAAIAGGLGIWLAGPRAYGNRVIVSDRFNPQGRDAETDDIHTALKIVAMAQIIVAVLLLVIGWPVISAIGNWQ